MSEWSASRRETLEGISMAAVGLLGVSRVRGEENSLTVTVDPTDVTVAPGETTTIEVVLIDAQEGVDTYEIELTLEGSIATFQSSSEYQGDHQSSEITDNGQTMQFATALGGDTYDGADEIAIGNVTTEGESAGQTPLAIPEAAVSYPQTEPYDASGSGGGVTAEEPESASFEVTIVSTNSPVDVGETLTVTARVENTGNAEGTQTAELVIGGLGSDSTSMTLGAGSSTTESFSIGTNEGDADTYTGTVSTDDDSDSTTVTIEEGGESYFAVSIRGTNSPVEEGEDLMIEAEITNTGDESDTQTVELLTGGLGSESTTVSLGGGDSTTESLSIGTNEGDAGEYTATVSSDDDEETQDLTVLAPAAFTVTIDSMNDPVVEGDTLEVTVAVENTGDESTTQTLQLDAGPLGSDATTASLDGGDSTERTLSVDTDSGDAGDYTVDVSSDDDSDTTTATILAPAAFDISITETTSLTDGDTLDVTVIVENTGDDADMQTISIEAAGRTDSTEVSLDGGEDTTETPSIPTDENDAGDVTVTASSDDVDVSETVAVLEPAAFDVSITETTSPIAGDTLDVTVIVENTGDIEGTQSVTVEAAGGSESTEITLDGGNTVTETLSAPTNEDDADEVTVTTSSDDDEVEETVTLRQPDTDDGTGAGTGTGDDGSTDTDGGNDGDGVVGSLGTTEMVVGGGGGLVTLLGLYALMRQSDDETVTEQPSSSGGGARREPAASGQSGTGDSGQSPAGGDTKKRIKDRLDQLDAALPEAQTRFEEGAYDRALAAWERASEHSESARDLARAEAPDRLGTVEDRLATIQQMRDSIRAQRREVRLSEVPIPDLIPGPPVERLSLSYDDIEKGDPIGKGGNADVFLATDVTDGDEFDIALKEPRMSGTLHTDVVERMMTEAETWQQLDAHDHIVGVLDYDSEPLPWIAMEYMNGGHLGERATGMSLPQKLWTAIVVTEAVKYAHEHGVAHLDLKPANILFREVESAWDAPKVADWGLSKHLLEHSKSIEGMSPHYAAPEQFDSDKYGRGDQATDVYQLGAVFYELFTGRPPFEGKPFEVMKKIEREDPTPPSELVDIPPGFDDTLLTAMATEKRDRYESVLYLRDELQALSDEEFGSF